MASEIEDNEQMIRVPSGGLVDDRSVSPVVSPSLAARGVGIGTDVRGESSSLPPSTLLQMASANTHQPAATAIVVLSRELSEELNDAASSSSSPLSHATVAAAAPDGMFSGDDNNRNDENDIIQAIDFGLEEGGSPSPPSTPSLLINS